MTTLEIRTNVPIPQRRHNNGGKSAATIALTERMNVGDSFYIEANLNTLKVTLSRARKLSPGRKFQIAAEGDGWGVFRTA